MSSTQSQPRRTVCPSEIEKPIDFLFSFVFVRSIITASSSQTNPIIPAYPRNLFFDLSLLDNLLLAMQSASPFFLFIYLLSTMLVFAWLYHLLCDPVVSHACEFSVSFIKRWHLSSVRGPDGSLWCENDEVYLVQNKANYLNTIISLCQAFLKFILRPTSYVDLLHKTLKYRWGARSLSKHSSLVCFQFLPLFV